MNEMIETGRAVIDGKEIIFHGDKVVGYALAIAASRWTSTRSEFYVQAIVVGNDDAPTCDAALSYGYRQAHAMWSVEDGYSQHMVSAAAIINGPMKFTKMEKHE